MEAPLASSDVGRQKVRGGGTSPVASPGGSSGGLALSFPVQLGSERAVNAQTLSAYYKATEQTMAGGYFPLGANTVWHGGVHLQVPPGHPVHACQQGRVVAARLLGKGREAVGHYGSRNFILVEHAWDETRFYSLYMHLQPLALEPGELSRQNITWLDEEVLKELRNKEVARLDRPVDGGQRLWLSGEHGSEGSRTGLLHWEIFSEEHLFAPDDQKDNQKDDREGYAGTAFDASTLPSHSASVTGVTGPTTALVGQRLTYRAKLSKRTPSAAEKANISWKVWCVEKGATPSDGEEQERRAWWNEREHKTRAHHGAELTITPDQEMAGKRLIARPYRSYIEPGKIEVVTEVSTLETLAWKAVEDDNDDFTMDLDKILDLFEEYQKNGWFGSDEVVDVEELKRFYAEADEARTLRSCACKFVSEWGIPDLEAAVDQLRGRYITWGLADRLRPYQWWQEARAAGVDLPESAHVWHYNPIAALQQLWHEGYGQLMTLDQLIRAVPRAEKADLEKFIDVLNSAMRKYEINTPLRIAYFIAQVGHESWSFGSAVEDGSEAYFNANYGPDSTVGPELGNTEEGDGARFRGRGLIQLTGRSNYEQYGNYRGIDLTSDGNWERVADPSMAADVAGWYWSTRSLNNYADADDLRAVTLRINGGYNGLEDRKRRLKNAKKVFVNPE